MIPKKKTWRSKKYLEWIKEQPCYWCGRFAEPHHIKGVGCLGGAGQKAPDWAVMPLCHTHHMEMHQNVHLWDEQWEMVCRTLGKAIDEGVLSW